MEFSLAGIIRQQAALRPDAPALTSTGRTLTFAELDRRSSQVAQALATEGVGHQERVAFIEKNSAEWFEVLLGGAKLNAVNVSVNWRLSPREMAEIVNDADARVLVVGHEFRGHLAEFEDQLTSVTKTVVLGGDHDGEKDKEKHERYEDWLARHPANDPGAASGPDDVAFQLYTSGTTGLPKGVMLTNANFGMVDRTSVEWALDAASVNLVAMPLFHIGGGGWAIIGMWNGAHSVVLREVDPGAVLDAVPRHGVTNAFLVPAVIQMMLLHPDCPTTDFSSLRTVLYGASPISSDVLSRAIETFGCGFAQAYGLTETTGAVTILRPGDHEPDGPRAALLRSCGLPFAWVEIRIADPDSGEPLPVGQVGEIWTRSAQNMKGYWRKPDETAKTITADGWLRTGDAGYLDGAGYVFIHDRVKDMVVSGGENIYPAEVENVLFAHPGVADVAVIGVPSERWGETVKAVVVRKASADGDALTADELIAFSRARLAHFKCPTSVDFVEVLPRNPSGKVLKRQLREPYWAGTSRGVG
jgi:long-chain acyl-CoA synthetase